MSGCPCRRWSRSAELFELVGVEEVGFVEHEDDVAAAFVFLGGEQIRRLGDERGFVEAWGAAEGGDDGGCRGRGRRRRGCRGR